VLFETCPTTLVVKELLFHTFVSHFRLRNTLHTLCRTKFEYRWINSLEIEVHINYTLDFSFSVFTSQRTKYIPILKTTWLMMFWDLIATCCENNRRHANVLFGILH